MKVTIFHNVQRGCRTCGQPAVSLGDDQYVHRQSDAGHDVASVFSSGFDGYRVGDAMSRVFEAELPDVPSRTWVLEQLSAAFNDGPAPEFSDLARAYRARRLRSLSVGDVIEVDGTRYACGPVLWADLPKDALFRMVPSREAGSVSLPACSYCDVTGDDSTLEPFNLAGNLACRDVRACSARMSESLESRA